MTAKKHNNTILTFFLIFITLHGITAFNRNYIWTTRYTLVFDNLAKTPYSGRLHNDAGNIYSKADNFIMAEKHYLKGISLIPGYERNYLNLGNLYGKFGDFKKAHHYIEMAIKINPSYAKAYYNLAYLELKEGNKKQGLLELEKALKLKPYYSKALELKEIIIKQQNQ